MGDSSNHSCGGGCKKALELLQPILDGVSSKEDEAFFKTHIDKCGPCWEHYNIDKSVVDAVKTKIERKCCPSKLMNSIKDSIKNFKL